MPGQRGSEERRMPLETLVRMDWVLHQRLTAAALNQEGGPVTLAGYIRALIDQHVPEVPDIEVPAYLPPSRPREQQKPLGSDVQALETIPRAAGKVAGLTRHLGKSLRERGEVEGANILIKARDVLGDISLWAVKRLEIRIEKNCGPIDEGRIYKMAEAIIESGRRLDARLGENFQTDGKTLQSLNTYVAHLHNLFERLKDAERGPQ